MSAIAQYFKFAERGTNISTETRAGLTTFMVMAYIIFLNPLILMGGFGDADPAFTAVAISAGTALVAGIMTIAMGAVGNFPLALAAGLGINGIVAFSLTGRGLSPAGAMGVILLEGIAVTILVLVGAPRGRHERRSARAQAGDRRRHRPVHPVHRLRERRVRGRQRAGHADDVPPADDRRRLRVLDRPDPHDRAVGPAREGGADHQHPGDDARSRSRPASRSSRPTSRSSS